MAFTQEDYKDAIEALTRASTQLAPDGLCCAVCGDNGHQAWECYQNPLVILNRYKKVEAVADEWHEQLHIVLGYDRY